MANLRGFCTDIFGSEESLLFLLDHCTTSETFHDMQITVARATNYVDRIWERSANYSARTFLLPIDIHTDHCLKNSCKFPNNILFPSLIQKNKPTQSATIDLTLWIHCTKDVLKLQRDW